MGGNPDGRRSPVSVRLGGTPPIINKGGRPKGIPNEVTPAVAGIILQMKAETKKVAHIARELNPSRQTVYEVLQRAGGRRRYRVSRPETRLQKAWGRSHHPASVLAFVPSCLLQRRRRKSRTRRPARRAVWAGAFDLDAGGRKKLRRRAADSAKRLDEGSYFAAFPPTNPSALAFPQWTPEGESVSANPAPLAAIAIPPLQHSRTHRHRRNLLCGNLVSR